MERTSLKSHSRISLGIPNNEFTDVMSHVALQNGIISNTLEMREKKPKLNIDSLRRGNFITQYVIWFLRTHTHISQSHFKGISDNEIL